MRRQLVAIAKGRVLRAPVECLRGSVCSLAGPADASVASLWGISGKGA